MRNRTQCASGQSSIALWPTHRLITNWGLEAKPPEQQKVDDVAPSKPIPLDATYPEETYALSKEVRGNMEIMTKSRIDYRNVEKHWPAKDMRRDSCDLIQVMMKSVRIVVIDACGL